MSSLLTKLSDPELQRAGLLLVPLLAASVLLIANRPTPRQATAAMVAFLWQLPAVLVLNLMAIRLGWWSFDVREDVHFGLPIDVWIGWAIWWGPVAVFLQARFGAMPVIALMVAIDLVSMPLLSPLVRLAPDWHMGEVVALALCLLPALYFARLTETDTDPVMRTRFHAIGWGGYILLVLPSAALAWDGRDPLAHLARPQPADALFLAVLSFNLLLGLAAALEFARVGGGTPIPFDPPKRVVTTGPYAFCANPMQVTSLIIMLALAAHTLSPALAFIAIMFGMFDAIYATWYNRTHISRAMPDTWVPYRANVHEWRLRWRPYIPNPATLTLPDTSAPCRLLARILRDLDPINLTVAMRPGLEIHARERLVYEMPAHELQATGIPALWRALEHTNLLIVCAGWFIGLPLITAILEALSSKVPLRLLIARREAARNGRG